MPFHRNSRSRPRMVGSVIQSYKKVLNEGGTSRAAATDLSIAIATGVDSVAAGQTSATDGNVPTGCVIKAFEIQYSSQNLVNVASFLNWTVQKIHSGQTPITPLGVGGNAQRNQCHRQGLYCMGQFQSANRTIKFLVPKKFQRMREGDGWRFTRNCSTIFTDAIQVIYKFYR